MAETKKTKVEKENKLSKSLTKSEKKDASVKAEKKKEAVKPVEKVKEEKSKSAIEKAEAQALEKLDQTKNIKQRVVSSKHIKVIKNGKPVYHAQQFSDSADPKNNKTKIYKAKEEQNDR